LDTTKFQDIVEGSVDDALAYRQNVLEKGGSLRRSETSLLLQELVTCGRLEEAFDIVKGVTNFNDVDTRLRVAIRRLLSAAAEKGMIEAIDEICQLTERKFGGFQLQKAFIAAGKKEEFFQRIENGGKEAFDFFLTSEIVKSDPVRIENICRDLAKRGINHFGAAQLFYLHVAHGDTAKARDLLNELPSLEASLGKLRIQQTIKQNFDVAFFSRLTEIVKDSSILERALVCTVHELVWTDKIPEANKCFEFAKEKGISTAIVPSKILSKMGQEEEARKAAYGDLAEEHESAAARSG